MIRVAVRVGAFEGGYREGKDFRQKHNCYPTPLLVFPPFGRVGFALGFVVVEGHDYVREQHHVGYDGCEGAGVG